MNVNKENIVELARELVSSLIGTNAEIEFGEKFDAVVEAGNYNEDGLEKVISDYRDEFMPSVVLQEASEENDINKKYGDGDVYMDDQSFLQALQYVPYLGKSILNIIGISF